ncbi:MAG: ABC transporter permease subunit [Alphaproteobacteria bacterium]|nr:ABC transporter permease subunit [Alphaproteobacteria bacterium]
MSAWRRWGPPLGLALAVIALWQVLHWIAGRAAVASPWETALHTWNLLHNPRLAGHAIETARAFALAAAIAVLAGVALGLALGAHRLTGDVAEPILMSLYSLPKVTLYPIMLLIFGLGISAKVAFGALHGILPVMIFSMNAIRNLDRILIKSARAMALGPRATAVHVLLPAALPQIFTGVRLGVSLALLGTMIGELFASQRGLGFMLLAAIERHDVHTIGAVIVLLTGFALALSAGLMAIERRLHRSP